MKETRFIFLGARFIILFAALGGLVGSLRSFAMDVGSTPRLPPSALLPDNFSHKAPLWRLAEWSVFFEQLEVALTPLDNETISTVRLEVAEPTLWCDTDDVFQTMMDV